MIEGNSQNQGSGQPDLSAQTDPHSSGGLAVGQRFRRQPTWTLILSGCGHWIAVDASRAHDC
jgi:hypothetical protein